MDGYCTTWKERKEEERISQTLTPSDVGNSLRMVGLGSEKRNTDVDSGERDFEDLLTVHRSR